MLKKCIIAAVGVSTLVFGAGVVAGMCADKETLRKIRVYLKDHGCSLTNCVKLSMSCKMAEPNEP